MQSQKTNNRNPRSTGASYHSAKITHPQIRVQDQPKTPQPLNINNTKRRHGCPKPNNTDTTHNPHQAYRTRLPGPPTASCLGTARLPVCPVDVVTHSDALGSPATLGVEFAPAPCKRCCCGGGAYT
jgi:hypothetical protein